MDNTSIKKDSPKVIFWFILILMTIVVILLFFNNPSFITKRVIIQKIDNIMKTFRNRSIKSETGKLITTDQGVFRLETFNPNTPVKLNLLQINDICDITYNQNSWIEPKEIIEVKNCQPKTDDNNSKIGPFNLSASTNSN